MYTERVRLQRGDVMIPISSPGASHDAEMYVFQGQGVPMINPNAQPVKPFKINTTPSKAEKTKKDAKKAKSEGQKKSGLFDLM